MSWTRITQLFVDMLPHLPHNHGCLHTRETWEVAAQVKDAWQALGLEPPINVYTQEEEIIFDLGGLGCVLFIAFPVRCRIEARSQSGLVMRVECELEQLRKHNLEISSWLNSSLKLNSM